MSLNIRNSIEITDNKSKLKEHYYIGSLYYDYAVDPKALYPNKKGWHNKTSHKIVFEKKRTKDKDTLL